MPRNQEEKPLKLKGYQNLLQMTKLKRRCAKVLTTTSLKIIWMLAIGLTTNKSLLIIP